jgi:hypothetical protein
VLVAFPDTPNGWIVVEICLGPNRTHHATKPDIECGTDSAVEQFLQRVLSGKPTLPHAEGRVAAHVLLRSLLEAPFDWSNLARGNIEAAA